VTGVKAFCTRSTKGFFMNLRHWLLCMGLFSTSLVDPSARAADFSPPPLSYIHIFSGPDGTSHAKRETWTGEPIPSKSFAGALEKYFGAKASKVFIISLRAGLQTPQHNSGGKREFSVVLKGGGTITLSDGQTQIVKAGDVLLIEDLTGPGTRITFGQEGYVALTALLAS